MNDEIHNHYFRHNMQNELINLFVSEIKTKIVKKNYECEILFNYT